MINNLIIASESSNLYTTERFLIEGNKLKLKTQFLNPYDQSIFYGPKKIKTSKNALYLFRTTGIRFDDFDLRLAETYESENNIISNPLTTLQQFRSKDYQQLFFQRCHLPFIQTISYRGALKEELIESLKILSPSSNYILKMNRGNGGIGVSLIRGLDSLLSILETFHAIKDQQLIIQPYLPHQKEYRIFTTKNKILALIEKTINEDDFRGNSKRSKAKAQKKIDQSMADVVLKIMNESKLDYAGIDLFENSDGYKILEVNAIPGFKQVEELAKINVARELIIDILTNS